MGTILQTHMSCPELSIAASGGIGTSVDLVRALLAGADVAMVTSAIYRDGVSIIRTILNGLENFMEDQGFQCMGDLLDHRPVEFSQPDDRERYAQSLTRKQRASATLKSSQTHP